MKLNRLRITNVLGIEALDMDLSQAPLHLIVGENESGKSSIRDSLQVALTGQARGFKKHEDQAYLIREGAKAADIKITLADGRAITWHKTPKVAATRTGPIPEDAVMMAILADPLHFLSLEDKARREIIFRLIPGLNSTAEEISNKLVGLIFPGNEKIVEMKIPEYEAIDHLGKKAATEGFAAAETEAITRRRLAKRTRDDAQIQEPETKATIGGVLRILPDIQTADVEAGLTTIRTERDKLQQKRGKVEAQADKLPELEQALASLEAGPPEAPNPDRPVEDFVKALEINRGILEKCRAKVAALTEGSDPKAFPDTCPVYGVDCPSSRKVAVKGTKPQDVDPMALSLAQANLAEQEREVDLINQDLQAARAQEDAYIQFQKNRLALTDKIAKLKEQQAQAQDTAAIDEQITALDARMKTGYELLDAVREFWRKKEAADQAREKVAQADKEVALYDALAKALAPDGIPSQLIAEALEPVNERLRFASSYLFPEFEESPLVLTQDLEVYRSSPYACLSKSARYRAGIAFQFVLAHLAGARLLMIDEADILDPVNRAQLIDFLLAVRQDFDTILVFATSDHADPSPVPDMIRVWWLENGQISDVWEPVRAKEAA